MSTFSQQWDPKAILYQIVTIQCCYYLVLGGLIVIADLLFNCFSQLRLDQLFDPSILSFHTPLGLASMTAFVANSIITCVDTQDISVGHNKLKFFHVQRTCVGKGCRKGKTCARLLSHNVHFPFDTSYLLQVRDLFFV